MIDFSVFVIIGYTCWLVSIRVATWLICFRLWIEPGGLFTGLLVTGSVCPKNSCRWIFTLSFKSSLICFPFLLGAPSFKDNVLTAYFTFDMSLSANVLLCFLFCSALFSPEISTTHISSQGQLIQNCGGCWWFKNHIKALVLVTACPDEGGCPTAAQGIFLFSWYSRDLHFSLTFSAAKKTWKKHKKASATRLQLQQSECINDQQMSHKVTGHPTGIWINVQTNGAGGGYLGFRLF